MADENETVKNENQESLDTMFEQLEQVLDKLEDEELGLEESFKLYDEGMKLLKKCNDTIDTVEKEIRVLDEEGEEHEF